MHNGRVVSIRGERAIVFSMGKEYSCIVRGNLKKARTHEKNVLAVGDLVQFSLDDNLDGAIEKIEKRRSVLTRMDTVQKKLQIIAVNIDYVFITVSLVNPPLKLPLIDRYLIACKKGNMNPILVINKLDLLDDLSYPLIVIEKEKGLYKEALFAYEKIGLPILSVCTIDGRGISSLKKMMEGKTSVFSGQSGTGKSSLINAVCNTDLAVQETIRNTRKGSHTTTRASLISIGEDGFVVDTPGIKSFGLWDLTKEDIVSHFTDIKEIGEGCRFKNCMHLKEPGCAVKEALLEKKLSSLRFASYLSLIESIGKKDRWR